MEEIDVFGLEPKSSELPRSRLLWRGEPVGLTVDGVVLAKQYRLAGGYLLLLTEDLPYEEGLHIYLLDNDRRLREAIELGGPYASAVLDDVRVEGEMDLSFSFFGDDRWRLRIESSPRVDLTDGLLFSPVTLKAGHRLRRWLRLDRSH